MATAGNTVNKIQRFSYTNANNTTVYNTDLTVKGNLTVVGTSVYAQTEVVIVKDNIITLNAAIGQSDTPLFNAGIEVDRGNQPNVSLIWNESSQAWQFTNNGSTYESLGGGSSGVYANGAFLQANGAYAHANAAFISANNVAPQVQPAFDKANAAYAFANTTTAWGTRQAFVATAGQTIFSPGSGYLSGYIDVYYNGIKLYGGEDYTATDGVNVTLANPATVNSIIEIVGFGANVPVANVYVLNSMASIVQRQTFYANSGQTIFTVTGGYRVGYIDVYYNGIKVNIPEDVTAGNGTTITFVGLTPTVNSIIEVVGLTPNVAIANAISITGGTISGGLNLAGNVNPTTDNTYYLGSSTNRWHSLFVGPGSIDIGGLKLSNVGGVLSVSSPGSPATPIAGEDNWVRAQANAAFIKANTPSHVANSAALYANGAFTKANSGVQYNANSSTTGSLAVPIGTTAERPANPQSGMLRYNTTTAALESYMPTVGWKTVTSDSFSVEILIVGGGASGGYSGGNGYEAGGGGAGGLLYYGAETPFTGAAVTLNPGTSYTVIIGAGGAGTNSTTANGSNSSFHTFTAEGGGSGGNNNNSATGYPGASGGGGLQANPGGAGKSGQGYPGGNGTGSRAGGGGGAGGPGGNGDNPNLGGGYAAVYGISGTNIQYAGGGSGGNAANTTTQGGGGIAGPSGTNHATIANRGSGGGGSNPGGPTGSGGTGSSGVVILRYLGTQKASGGTITSIGGYTVHTFTGSGTFSVT